MNNKKYNFNFNGTGIGSVPFTDIKGTCLNIVSHLPQIPFWPQLVNRSLLEDMSIQFSEGLPLLVIEEARRILTVSSENMETELATFYDRFLADDTDYFKISNEYAPGLNELIELIKQDPDRYGDYIKGHSVGPITFCSGLMDDTGKSVLYNPDLSDAYTKGLAIKALWQVQELSRTGKKTIIFFDEPSLTGFGSAFSAIERDEVIRILKEVIDYVKERTDTLVGIHCCGNTDWPMLFESGPDIINFDAYSFMDHFLLYPEQIIDFVQNDGIIAWGIVPTSDFSDNITIAELRSKLDEGLKRLSKWGISSEIIKNNSILTPACGMGSMEPDSSEKVINLLSRLIKDFNA
jgi:hypothetical protein